MNSPPLAGAILVGDDDADSREMLAEYLQAEGFTVHAAPTGELTLAPGRHWPEGDPASSWCPKIRRVAHLATR